MCLKLSSSTCFLSASWTKLFCLICCLGFFFTPSKLLHITVEALFQLHFVSFKAPSVSSSCDLVLCVSQGSWVLPLRRTSTASSTSRPGTICCRCLCAAKCRGTASSPTPTQKVRSSFSLTVLRIHLQDSSHIVAVVLCCLCCSSGPAGQDVDL